MIGDMEEVKILKVVCKNCKRVIYSKEGECRYDFGERLKSDGHFLTSYNTGFICKDCKEEM